MLYDKSVGEVRAPKTEHRVGDTRVSLEISDSNERVFVLISSFLLQEGVF